MYVLVCEEWNDPYIEYLIYGPFYSKRDAGEYANTLDITLMWKIVKLQTPTKE